MKDAKGHGSDPRGGQKVAAQWRTAHAAHQDGIIAKLPSLVKAFAKDQSGLGHPLTMEREIETRTHALGQDPERAARFLAEAGHTVAHAEHMGWVEGGKMLTHLAHFLGFLGAIAVMDVLVQSIGHLT